MINKVLEYVKKYRMIESEDTIVAGISGGADSVCLLFILLEIRRRIPFFLRAVHINHGIRPDAARDACYVRELCARQNIPFFLVEENVRQKAREHRRSEEEEGRILRYEAFERVLGAQKGRIAVAHNSNDRAETMLFHLFRGTGLGGMSGIPPVNGKIIRPLLCLTRNEIEFWLKEQNISFCLDSTNASDDYTRNRIRHHILPYAEEEICHGAVSHMNQAADQLLMAEDFLRKQTDFAMERCLQTKDAPDRVLIHIPSFLKEDEFLRGRILLNALRLASESRKDITSVHINSTEAFLRGTGSGEIHLPYGLTVYRKYDLGIIQRGREISPPCAGPEVFEISIPSRLVLPGLGRVEFTVFKRDYSQIFPQKTYTKWFDYDKITSVVVFRTRQAGDYLTINRSLGRKSLQDYFVNQKIPRQERPHIYLLAENSHVIWIPGFRISEYYKVDENTKTILQVRFPDKEQ